MNEICCKHILFFSVSHLSCLSSSFSLLYPVSRSAGLQDTKEVWFIIRPPFHVLWKPSPEECHPLTAPAYIGHTSRSVHRHWAMRTPLFISAWIEIWLYFSSLLNTLGEVIRWLSGWACCAAHSPALLKVQEQRYFNFRIPLWFVCLDLLVTLFQERTSF